MPQFGERKAESADETQGPLSALPRSLAKQEEGGGRGQVTLEEEPNPDKGQQTLQAKLRPSPHQIHKDNAIARDPEE